MATLDTTNPVYTETLYLNVTLRDINNEESVPVRYFPIGAPWSFKIGRGSQSELNLQPQDHNSWFASRVMSREHAVVRIDPVSRTISIEDTESMHGTYIRGKRLRAGRPEEIFSDDTIVFGADILRGDVTYRALMVKVSFDWSDGEDQESSRFSMAHYISGQPAIDPHDNHNTFTSEYDDAEHVSDDEVELVEPDLIVLPRPEETRTITQSRKTFTVPDSDDSDSDYEENHVHSSSSSSEEDNDLAEVDSSETIPEHPNNAENCGATPLSSQTSASEVVVIGDEQHGAIELDKMTRLDKILQDAQDVFDHPGGDDDECENSEADGYEGDENTRPKELSMADIMILSSGRDLSPAAAAEQPQAVYTTIAYESQDPSSSIAAAGANAKVNEITSVWSNEPQLECEMPQNYTFHHTLPPVSEAFDSLHAERSNPEAVPSSAQYFTKPGGRPNGSEQISEMVPHKRFSKVSISDIINQTNLPIDSTNHKRKAVELESAIEVTTLGNGAVESLQMDAGDGLVPNANSQSRKKIKIDTGNAQQASRGRTFLKYAATAVAAATVGAVSTIFGLAALPADYFV